MKCLRIAFLAIGIGLVSHLQATAEEAKLNPKQLEFFEKQVRPLLVARCYECHSAKSKQLQGNLLLDSREGWRRGGELGPAIAPGDVDDSLLIQAIRYEGLEMPPKQQMPADEIAILERWVKMGVPDPRSEPTLAIRREIDIEAGKRFWAFVHPQDQPVPKVQDKSWPRDDIDRFILHRLEQEGLKPSQQASRQVLIRRLYFDLVGLPPSPEAIASFLANESENAVIELVDQLLGSPEFGQRWGRHWLDVARYAESTGMERNLTFPTAWRYRDYVIRSLNADKPFDQFVQEQLAGDLLLAENPDEELEQLIATAFLAIGPKSLNERNKNVFLMDLVDEQIDITSRALLGLTVSCARCHDHKFDPVPTRDYYALAGIFRSSQTHFGTGRSNGNRQPSTLIPLTEGATGPTATTTASPLDANQLKAQIKKLSQPLNESKRILSQAKRRKDRDNPEVQDRIAHQTQRIAKLTQQIDRLRKQLKNAGKKPKSPPTGIIGVLDGEPQDCRIHIRGEVSSLGDTAPRGYLTVVEVAGAAEMPADESGRLELARWITSRDNPLTARVLVNRVWHHLFGLGIVETVDNFGQSGARPSHPELLDHLALRFMDEGWSIKHLVRTIVLSSTYQQSSDFDKRNYEADPENRLVWRMSHRRLNVESLRDAVLAASGQLDLTPPKSSPVAKIGNADVGQQATVLNRLEEAPQNIRSVYLPIVRNAVPEMFNLFDFAEPSIIVGRRQVTTVPTQALYLMNSPFILQAADRMAESIVTKNEDLPARLETAYLLAIGRSPTPAEFKRSEAFIARCAEQAAAQQDGSAQQETLAWASLCQALLASAEFRYIE